MKKVYKAHILFTKEKDHFEVFENGYIAVEDGIVLGVASSLDELNAQCSKFNVQCSTFNVNDVVDFGDKLLIPAMNDMHVHAPQVHNQGVAMDLELLPWLQNYTFPEESKYADTQYAERMYRRFLHTQWLFGTMRSVVFGTVHTESTRILMKLYQEAGMGAMVGKVAMNRNCPEALCEDVDAYVEGQERLIKEFSNLSPLTSNLSPLVSPIITPRFVPSCTPELLKACGELANKYQLPVQSHLSENTSEIAWVAELEKESTSYGDAYNRYGLFQRQRTGTDEAQPRDGSPLSDVELQPVVRPGSRPHVPRRGPAHRAWQRHQRRSRPQYAPHAGLRHSGQQDALPAGQEQGLPHPLRSLLDCHQVGRLVLRPCGQLRTGLRVRRAGHRRRGALPVGILAAAPSGALHLCRRRPPDCTSLLSRSGDSRAQTNVLILYIR